jgi:hypothetical protein
MNESCLLRQSANATSATTDVRVKPVGVAHDGAKPLGSRQDLGPLLAALQRAGARFRKYPMTDALRVLMVEDSATDAKLIVRALRTSGRKLEFERMQDAASMRAAL